MSKNKFITLQTAKQTYHCTSFTVQLSVYDKNTATVYTVVLALMYLKPDEVHINIGITTKEKCFLDKYAIGML